MRTRRRSQPLQHVLVAGDVAELDAIRSLLLLLPDDAYGQVYVGAPAGTSVPALTHPERVTVTCLRRGDGPVGDASLAVASIATMLASAVTTWIGEWMPTEPEDDREFSMWVGASAYDLLDPTGVEVSRL